jgi:hypothetical protein
MPIKAQVDVSFGTPRVNDDPPLLWLSLTLPFLPSFSYEMGEKLRGLIIPGGLVHAHI